MTQAKNSPRSREIQALVNDRDFLKGLVQKFLQEFLEIEITEFLGAALYERLHPSVTIQLTGRSGRLRPRFSPLSGEW